MISYFLLLQKEVWGLTYWEYPWVFHSSAGKERKRKETEQEVRDVAICKSSLLCCSCKLSFTLESVIKQIPVWSAMTVCLPRVPLCTCSAHVQTWQCPNASNKALIIAIVDTILTDRQPGTNS
jgi:hypothetical protein